MAAAVLNIEPMPGTQVWKGSAPASSRRFTASGKAPEARTSPCSRMPGVEFVAKGVVPLQHSGSGMRRVEPPVCLVDEPQEVALRQEREPGRISVLDPRSVPAGGKAGQKWTGGPDRGNEYLAKHVQFVRQSLLQDGMEGWSGPLLNLVQLRAGRDRGAMPGRCTVRAAFRRPAGGFRPLAAVPLQDGMDGDKAADSRAHYPDIQPALPRAIESTADQVWDEVVQAVPPADDCLQEPDLIVFDAVPQISSRMLPDIDLKTLGCRVVAHQRVPGRSPGRLRCTAASCRVHREAASCLNASTPVNEAGQGRQRALPPSFPPEDNGQAGCLTYDHAS